MNAVAPRALDMTAIGAGAALGIVLSLATSVLWALIPPEKMVTYLSIVMAASYGLGALIDGATGACAGWMAKQRGSLHGMFAGLIANVVSLGVGYAITLVRTDYGRSVEEVIQYLASLLPWQIVGVALASLAGGVAASFARRQAAA